MSFVDLIFSWMLSLLLFGIKVVFLVILFDICRFLDDVVNMSVVFICFVIVVVFLLIGPNVVCPT